MNKQDLVAALYRSLGSQMKMSRVQAGVDAFLELIQIRAQMSQPTYVKYLGRFDVRLCKARKRRNPRTGAQCLSPDYYKVVFRPSRSLIKALR